MTAHIDKCIAITLHFDMRYATINSLKINLLYVRMRIKLYNYYSLSKENNDFQHRLVTNKTLRGKI